jgi:tetratricopeptide (TPR) repeat protein
MSPLPLLLFLTVFPQDLDEQLQKANAMRARGDVDAAIQEYTRIYEKHPKALVALVNRGGAKLQKGDIDGAIEDSNRAIKAGARMPAAFINRGQGRKVKGDIPAALNDLTQAIELDPKHIRSYLIRADIKGQSGDLNGALKDCEQALQIEAASAEALASRAQWRRLNGDLKGAEADAAKAIELDPHNAMALFNRGVLHAQKKQLDAALKDLDQAIDGDPSVAMFWAARFALRHDSKDFDGALEDINQALRLEPTNPEYLFFRAGVRMSTAKMLLAKEDLEKALQIAPERWPLRREVETRLKVSRELGAVNAIRKAQALEDKSDLDQAIEAFQEAMGLDPDSPDIRKEVGRGYFVRGKARRDQRNYAGAVQDFTKAITLDPSSALFYANRGLAHYQNSAFSEAVQDFSKAFELNPKEVGYAYYLGLSYGSSRKQAQAVQWYTKALELSPNDVDTLIMRASMKFELGQFGDALEDCERALKLEPGKVGALFHRASCFLAKGEWKKASADYERVLQDRAESDWRGRATVMLSLLPELEKEKSEEPLARRLIAKARGMMVKKEFTRAIDLLEEVLRLDCRSKDGLETIALAHHLRNDTSKGDSRAAWLRALDAVELRQGLSLEAQKVLIARSTLVLGGLLWLARHQFPDGRWSASDFGELCLKDGSLRCDGKGRPNADLRATGVVLLSFLGAGYSQLSKDNYAAKPMGETIAAGLKWLMGRQNADGSFAGADAERFFEDQALAAMALSEAYGMTASAPLQEPARKAIDFLKSAFIPGKGWPRQKGGRDAEPQATGWVLLALWSGKMSELPGAEARLEEGFAAFQKQSLQGEPLEGGMGELLAMAVASCRRKPLPGNEVGLRLDKMLERPPKASDPSDPLRMFVVVLAMKCGGTERWSRWQALAKDALKKTFPNVDENFCPSGSVNVTSPREVEEGRLLATAVDVLSLELYYGYRNAFGTLDDPAGNK